LLRYKNKTKKIKKRKSRKIADPQSVKNAKRHQKIQKVGPLVGPQKGLKMIKSGLRKSNKNIPGLCGERGQ